MKKEGCRIKKSIHSEKLLPGLASLFLSAILLTGCGMTQAQTSGPSAEPAASAEAVTETAEPAEAGTETVEPAETVTETAEPVETGIADVAKYGNVTLTISPDTMRELGYKPADIILVQIGDLEMEMPIGTIYNDVESGNPICCFKTSNSKGRDVVVLCVNNRNFFNIMGLGDIIMTDEDPGYRLEWTEGYDESSTVRLSLIQKQGYAEEYALHQLTGSRTNKRSDYAELTDAEYANFREVNTSGIASGVLYRSSSPVNPALNRNIEADNALRDAGIKSVMNMADSEKTMRRYSDYILTAYSRCSITALDMEMDYTLDSFKAKLAEGFRFIATGEGPFLIHCNEGKDRTGFAVAVLECLTGASPEEVVSDYMITFYNFYGIKPGTEAYERIADSNIRNVLCEVFGIESIDAESVDLSACAHEYLKGIGMTDEEIGALKDKLRSQD